MDPGARARFATARAALRRLLFGYLGRSELPIDVTPNGKPYLRGADISFSVAHSGAWVLLAFAAGSVGVDVEEVRPVPELNSIGRLVFADRERRAVAAVPPTERLQLFFRTWVRKEAYAKAIGVGLCDAIRHVAIARVDGVTAEATNERTGVARPIGMFDLAVSPRSVGAVVVDQLERPPLTLEISM